MRAVRSPFVTFDGNPFEVGAEALRHEPDGLIVIDDGLIIETGPASDLLRSLPPGTQVDVYGDDHILLPGFIDTHVHYPQIEMTAAYGLDLLQWLETYTFPTERRFHDSDHARRVARHFLASLLRAGTTSAFVFCTVFPESVDAFFEESERLGTRMIAGKMLMDRNAPEYLMDTAQSGYDESLALGVKWHGRGRQMYAITPRFAPMSSPDQLSAAAELWREHPDWYVQTHLAETESENAWVRQLFLDRDGGLDTFARAGLVGPRAMLGHGIYLTPVERERLFASGAAIAHCPTSNLFLGSGLFPLGDGLSVGAPARIGLGTDLGAGTSFSQLRTMADAYKIQMLQGNAILDASHAYFLATAGGAWAGHLDGLVGRIAPGLEADLVVLNTRPDPYLDFRMDRSEDVGDTLFTLMTMGDDRAVAATYVAGERVFRRGVDADTAGVFEGPAAHLNDLASG